MTPEKGNRQRKHDRRCKEMFLRFLGEDRKAHSLNRRDWDAFIRERRSGRLRPAGKRKAKAASPRTVARDLLWLRAVLNWSTLAGGGRGGFLLERNPLKGLPIPKEENPTRPIMTHERYEAMLAKAGEVD